MTPPEPPDDEPRRRAAAAIRRVGHALVGGEHDDATLGRLAETLDGFSAALEGGAPRSRPVADFESRMIEPPPADGGELVSYSDRPVSGASSPWGLEPVIHRRGDRAVAVVTFRAAHEGAPGRAHGGVVAAVFDDLFGFVTQVEAVMAFTGELTVRYSRPTPLHVPVEFRAWLDRREGRRLHLAAESHVGEERIGRATALFVAVDTYSP